MTLRTLCILLFTTTAIAACSSSGKDDSSNQPHPQSPAEALALLSDQQRAAFDSWKQTAVKSCDASAAFGLDDNSQPSRQQDDEEGLDGSALLLNNGLSAVFTDGTQIAVMLDYDSLAGTADSTASQSQSGAGQSTTVSAEAKRDGSLCDVYLFGQKVYSTVIAARISVGTQFNPGKTASIVNTNPVVRVLGTNGSYETSPQGVFNVIDQAFSASKDGVAFVQKKLGLSDDQAEKLLQAAGTSTYIVRLANDGSAVWTNEEVGDLIAAQTSLTSAFSRNARASFEVRLGVPAFSFGAAANDGDAGGVKTLLSMTISKQGSGQSYILQSLQIVGTVAKDPTEATQCEKDRAAAYAGAPLVNGTTIQPSVHTLFAPCLMLEPNLQQMAYGDGFLKSLLPQIFAGVTPSTTIQYGGWDGVLSNYALDDLKAKQDVVADLDPNGVTQIVPLVASHLQSIQAAVGKAKNLGGSEDSLYQMGLTWSFNGQTVSPSRVAQITSAADNAMVPFKDSTLAMLNDLATQPNAHDDELNFAQTIDDAYRTQAQQALQLAIDLSYADFSNNVYAQILQQQTSVSALQQWSDTLQTIKTAIAKYTNLTPVKNTLVALSVKWLKSGEVAASGLSGIYAPIDNAIVPFTDSVQTLVSDLGTSLSAHQPELTFAQTVTPEYKQLAASIRDNSASVEHQDWGTTFFASVLQKQPSIDQVRVWNDLWAGALGYYQREKARAAADIGASDDWNLKAVIDTAASETWSSADFASVETIAPLAANKNSCTQDKTESSLADCAGMSLFSKKPGELLDPAFNGRYLQLAKDFIGYMNTLSGFDQTSTRWDLVDAFFGLSGPIWAKCDQNTFTQKAASLKSDVAALANQSDPMRRMTAGQDIRTLIEDCQ